MNGSMRKERRIARGLKSKETEKKHHHQNHCKSFESNQRKTCEKHHLRVCIPNARGVYDKHHLSDKEIDSVCHCGLKNIIAYCNCNEVYN